MKTNGKPISDLNDMMKEMYSDRVKELYESNSSLVKMLMDEDGWMRHRHEITKEDVIKYPRSTKAYELRQTKLWKVLA